MTPRTGRPKTENPKSEKLTIYMTKEQAEEADQKRSQDQEPERNLSAWFVRKFFEMLRKPTKK